MQVACLKSVWKSQILFAVTLISLFQSYNVGHTEKMTGVVSTHGAIYTCSGDKTIKVLHPTREPDLITTLAVHEKEIARVCFFLFQTSLNKNIAG